MLPTGMSKKNNKIHFRLPPIYMDDLLQKTMERDMSSYHLCARDIYMHAAAGADLRAVQTELESLRQELRTLRSDFIHLSANLLAHAGKLSPEQAQQWVKSNFER